jgi:hypothetical protein
LYCSFFYALFLFVNLKSIAQKVNFPVIIPAL